MRRITAFCLALPLIVLSLAHFGAAQNVSIQLTPQSLPIQIPAPGGSFSYIIAATNNGTTPQQVTVWCMLTLPNGNPWGPALGPVTVTLGTGQTLERLRTQNIPAYAPTGSYAFNAYIGIYPNTIWDSDSFAFEKTNVGAELWVARYNGPGNYSDQARSIAVDSSGNVCVTGSSYGSGTSADYATIKYDGSGNQLWVSRYNGPGNQGDIATSIAVDGGGNAYVTGYSTGSGTDTDYATVKYDASGNQIWVARYNGPGNSSDEAQSIAVDGGGNAYVTGWSYGSGSSYDYATVKYDASGNQLWVARYNGPGNGSDMAYSIAVDGGGNAYVTGESDSLAGIYTNYDYATVKYNSAGVQQWVARYNGPWNDWDTAYSIAVDGDSNAYVTGRSGVNGTSWDYATVKYDASGNPLWAALYNGPGNGHDYAQSIAVDGAGNAYVTGYGAGSGTYYDYATIKYDSAGTQQWVARYNGPGNGYDYAYSIAVDGGGNAYVTGYGYSGSGTINDYATVKYDASGNQLWAARYNGPGNSSDLAKSIAVGGDGNAYVTGSSMSVINDDYATIKYSGGNIADWMPVEATVFGQPLPQECRLEQNYPNPFNAKTVLSYQLPVASNVSLRVYDTAGKLVKTLVDGYRQAGEHELTWDAAHVAAGIYFARLDAGDYVGVQKMVLIK